MQRYRGRFAPSPTGPLHFGSLVAAVGSYLEAKSHHGEWLLRIEDLDPPRTMAGAADEILHALEAHQLYWDHAALYQGERDHHYQQALEQLSEKGVLFGCSCSRNSLKGESTYPGHCHYAQHTLHQHAVRIHTTAQSIHFDDQWQTDQQWNLSTEVGDFIIRRADGLFSYQLAVVVDDHLQGITHIVRGSDLLDSTPRQIYLQQQLGYSTPEYGHLPVATAANGQKLSKQNLATPLDLQNAVENLKHALRFLGHTPPPIDQLEPLWEWALTHWSPHRVPQQMTIPVK